MLFMFFLFKKYLYLHLKEQYNALKRLNKSHKREKRSAQGYAVNFGRALWSWATDAETI